MKKNILKCMALVLSLVCILCFPVPASATSQGTDGTELEVIQPQNLEIQLGEAWAGVEFELKTDAGMYPGVITVGEDGVLRLEIGGSENYILSCVNSSVEAPIPGETAPMEEGTEPEEVPTEEAVPSESANPTEVTGEADAEPTETLPADTDEGKLRCIEEAKRVCKPDGKIFFAFISNDMVILTMQQCQEDYLMNGDYNKETFRLDDFPFVFHTLDHCRELLSKAGIQICHEVASDGASELLQDLVNGLDEASYQQYLRYHFYICEKPEFLGMSNHLLFVGR